MGKSQSKLSQLVLRNLIRVRNTMGARQDEFADAMDVQRTDYNKRENGKTPLMIDDIGRLLERYRTIELADLFEGYETHRPVTRHTFSEKTLATFPFLEQIVLAANQSQVSSSEYDVAFLRSCLEYALKKLDPV